jgi:DNA-binding beta-propeller fold protein YncE
MVAPYTFVEKHLLSYIEGYQIVIGGEGQFAYFTNVSTERIYQRLLSPIESAYSSTAHKTSPALWGTNGNPTGLHFKPDGTRLYVVCNAFDYVKQFDMPVPWDVSSIVDAGQFTLLLSGANSYGIAFNPDGTKMFLSHRSTGGYSDDRSGRLVQHELSVPWDITSAGPAEVWNLYTYDPSSILYDPAGLTFNNTGTRAYVTSLSDANVYICHLATPWDVISINNIELDWNKYDYSDDINTQVYAQWMSPDESKLFVFGYDYDESTNYMALFIAEPPSPEVFWTNFRGQSEIIP